MHVTVYADTLVFINTFITYFLLMATRSILHNAASRLRVLVASLVGGFYSLVILTELPFYSDIILKIGICILLQVLSTGFRNIRLLLKGILFFIIINFLFAGMMFACASFLCPDTLLWGFGGIYFEASIPFVLSLTVAAYGLIRLVLLLTSGKAPNAHYGECVIRTSCGEYVGKGLFDTGNTLCDPFTGQAVIIVTQEFAQHIVPEEVHRFLTGNTAQDSIKNDSWQRKIRIFPFETIGGRGVIPAFRAESVSVSCLNQKLDLHNIFIAVTPTAFHAGEYDALFPCQLYEQIMEGEKQNAIHDHEYKATVS